MKTRTRIDRLTAAEKAMMRPHADAWIARALSTAPKDREAFAAAARDCYAAAKLAPPRVVWTTSPLAVALAGPASISARRRLRGDADAVRGAVDDAVGGAVRDAVGGAVGGAVRDAVRGAVGDEVRGAVGDAVGDEVGDAVYGAVRDAVDGAEWWRYIGGCAWASWAAYTSFYREIGLTLGDEMDRREDAYRRYISESWWSYPTTDCVIVCDSPERICRDDRGRLHAEDGMAIRWAGDGWGIYSWHGVTTTEQAIMRPWTLTVADVRAETNAEKRRVLVERMGPGRYLAESGASVIDVDSLALEGSATRALMRDSDGEQWLVGTDGSTRRVYHMPVSRVVRTCREAHEGISGIKEDRLRVEA